MSQREKLIELLAERCEWNLKKCVGCKENLPTAAECKEERFGHVADYLIENGVTIQETAEWEETGRTEFKYDTEIEEKCSACGRHVERYDTQPQDEYCPSCGRKMVLPEQPKEG